MKRKGLGRGLDAILAPAETEDVSKVEEISLDLIKANPFQPRSDFDEETLEELRSSIEEHGIIQPIILSKKGEGYEIVAGERRYRAARLAKLDKIPAIIRVYSDEDKAKLALVENIQREDLNPVDESTALKTLIDRHGLTQEEAAQIIGKSRVYVTNSLRLLGLPVTILDYIKEGKLSAGHGRALLSEESLMRQQILADLAIKEGMSVRQLEERASRKAIERKTKEVDVHYRDMETVLTESLGRKVQIRKNTVVLSYHGMDDLNKLIEKLK